MRSKRLLSMLLSVCLLVSVLSPAVYAVAPVEDSYIGSSAASKNETAKTEASPFENDKIITSEDMEQIDSMNLRDDPMLKPEVKEAETGNGSWSASKVDGKTPELDLPQAEVPAHIAELKEAAEIYAENDVVTAFVVMEDKPLAERYSSIGRVTALDEDNLLQIQDSIIAMIEKFVLGGKELDVRYQFTYLTNAFSVMTEFGNLSEIAMMDGVKSVYLMPVYHACSANQMDPLTASSGVMTGVPTVWEELDYRGEGMKIAIVDTGLDLDHPSFAEHDDFQITDSSLTVEKIDAVLSELNAYELRNTIAGKTLYRSAKVPYAFNYVDENLTADHSADVQGDHGTHVAGIAAANDNVAGTSVVGMAPEAQLVVMKVFGANGGAYTDDIIAALEDAMTLGCDVANLSLGAPAGFTSENEEIDAIYARIAEQDMVVCISAGNEGTSSYSNMWGTDMNTTANPDVAAVGSPGTYRNVTTVASVDNAVVMTPYFSVGEDRIFYIDPYEYMITMPEIIEWYGDTFEYVVVDGLGAGLVNAASAVSTESYLTVNGAKPKVSMGDSANGVYTFSFEVHNFGENAKVYIPDASVLTETVAGAQLSETEVVYFMYGMEQELTAEVSFSQNLILVQPGETVEVEVTITLSEEDKAFFDAAYPNGGYVEGYVYLNSLDEAGMNLPFLGFYGDWTEPPVFDSAFWYDNTFWGAAPVDGIPEGNEYYHVMWTSLPGTDWVLGFNPYTGDTYDENGNVIYDPARNVVSPNGDGAIDGLDEIYLSLMRNAKTLTITYTNADTGEVLSEEVITNARKTMFQSSYGQIVPWVYSWYGMGMYDFTDAEGNYLPNNTEVLLTFEADVDYGNGGHHTIQIPITVDTEAPELLGEIHHTENGNLLTLTVTDNVALADVFVMNNSGTQIWAEQSVFTRNEDGSYEVTIDVTGLGNSFTVILCDYGANESQYEIAYQNEDAGDNLPQVDTTKLYGYRVYDNYIYSEHMYGWISMDKPSSAEEPAFSPSILTTTWSMPPSTPLSMWTAGCSLWMRCTIW